MIHKNAPPTEYELLLPFSSSVANISTANLVSFTPTLRATLKEQWGDVNPGLSIDGEILRQFVTNRYTATLSSPVGSYTTGSVAGVLGSGYWRVEIHDYAITVNSDCSYSVSWSGIDGYLSINGGAETHPVTWGAYSYTGVAGDYIEQENATIAEPIFALPVWNPSWSCADSLVLNANAQAEFAGGGYRYKDAVGNWLYDPVIFDGGETGNGGACACFEPLGAIETTPYFESYTVKASDLFTWETYDVRGDNFSCACLPPISNSLNGYTYRRHRKGIYKGCGPIYIRDKRIPLGTEQIGTSWHCTDDTGTSSDSETDYQTVTEWPCKTSLSINVVSDDVFCVHVNGGNPCIFGITPGCYPTDTDYHCTYDGARGITYPDTMPCTSTAFHSVWNLITQDNRFLLAYTDELGAHIKAWPYNLPKGAYVGVDIDSGANWTQCRIAEDGRNRIYAVLSKDDGTIWSSFSDDGGKTWSTVTSMSTGYFATIDGRDADLLAGKFVYNTGTSGPGTIYLSFKGRGDASFGSWHQVKDSAGSAIQFEPTSFHARIADDNASRLVLSALVNGETDPSNWWSTDWASGGFTFTRFV